MGTSYSYGEIRYDDADIGADTFVDTSFMRDVTDTALHKADEAAQVRLHWMAPPAALWSGTNTAHSAIYGDLAGGGMRLGTGTDGQWYLFPVRAYYNPKLRADGSGYKLRIRLAGCASDTGTVDFGVMVVPGRARHFAGWYGGDPGDGLGYPVADHRFTAVTATSPAWLTPTSGRDYVNIPVELVEAAYAVEPVWTTQLDVGGAATSVVTPTLSIVPYAQTRTEGVVPHLYGVHAAEFVGKT